ncbi:MAG TPA: ABC transporter substrate-binding protein, partial [Acidimicrobiales bacterium]|nr:ABC transporter substrate-binding protein [Acidimicrobiales bacterium]
MTTPGRAGSGGEGGPDRAGARTRRHRRTLGCAAVLALVLAGCGGTAQGDAGAHATTTPTLVPASGGTVTVGVDQVPTTLNDHTVAGDDAAGRMVASAIWAQVFRVGPNGTPQLDTNVVDSAEVVDLDPQTVVYQVDPRATWSDGVPIDIDDFVYAWQSQRGGGLDTTGAPDSVASTLGYRDIDSVTGSNGGKTVTVVFRTPFGDWPSLFDDLLPAHIAEQVGWNDGFDAFGPAVEVSAGPWEVAAWQPGVSIELARNPHWWGSRAALDEVELRALQGPALAAALADGQVQVAYPAGFDPSLLAAVSSSSTLQSASNLGATVLQLEFNTKHDPLSSAPVRQGIAHDIDRAAVVTAVGEPENHLVWEDNDHLFANVQSGYDDDAAGYQSADPATATRLLDGAGLAQDGSGT